MNRKWVVILTVLVVVLAFGAGTLVYRDRTKQEASNALQEHGESLVRPHSPIYGNEAAKVTIVEFWDPSCETCRAFYPIVKGIVNSSFGQVRLVVRYAPLHPGSDTAVKILEAARQQGKFWQAVEVVMASQPRWAAHDNPQPEMIWELLGGIGLDVQKARMDANRAETEQLMAQDVADMKALKVNATPGFFVNGTPLRDFGAVQLKALVDQELSRAKTP